MVAERVMVAVAEHAVAPVPTREIVWLGEPSAMDRSLVGGKVAPLSRLAAQYRVPPGFALTTRAFELANDQAGTPGTDTDTTVPDALRAQIVTAYRRLAEL